MSGDVQNTMLAFVAVAALALAMQTIGMLVLLLVARKAANNVRKELEEYRSTLMPLILRAREVVQTVAPKVESAADELSAIASKLRAQTADVQAAADDIIGRTQRQVGRVDHMLSSIFDRVERAGTFMSDAVARPMRQLSGLIASARAVVETLRDPDARHSHPPRPYTDGEPLSGARTPPYRS